MIGKPQLCIDSLEEGYMTFCKNGKFHNFMLSNTVAINYDIWQIMQKLNFL